MKWLFSAFRATVLGWRTASLEQRLQRAEDRLRHVADQLDRDGRLRKECEAILAQAKDEAAGFAHALAAEKQRTAILEQGMQQMADIAEWQRAHVRAEIATQSRRQIVGDGALGAE